ncbi:MAG: YdjY domain-containing protein, partial [Planctomycetota bacterium]|nr:YdjY domain-containing protein [Planctomycetota bacterium]
MTSCWQFTVVTIACFVAPLAAQDQPTKTSTIGDPPAEKKAQPAPKLVPLNRGKTVQLDLKGRRLLVTTKVVLRDGVLEMLVCRKQTKEHESILAVDSKAYVIHTGLLALGSKTGKPVQFQPEFRPAHGQEIDIYFQWTDKDGKPQRARAQSWIRKNTRRFYVKELAKLPQGFKMPEDSELKFDGKHKELLWYGTMSAAERDRLLKLSDDKNFRKLINEFHAMSQPQEMTARFVFTGGSFYVDEETGQRSYLPESGEVVCVANFPSAMIDIAEKSSATEDQGLLYETYTERIPPIDTEVLVELIPVFKKAEKSR